MIAIASIFATGAEVEVGTPGRTSLRCRRFSVSCAMLAALVLLTGCNNDVPRSLDEKVISPSAASLNEKAMSAGARGDEGAVDEGAHGRQSASSADFSGLVAGIQDCEFEGWYMDAGTGTAAHGYFTNRDLAPCEVDSENDIAYFCVNESFHGIHVSKIEMQLSTAAMSRGLHLDLPVEDARRVLKSELGSKFKASARSRRGEAAELLADPSDPAKSMFLCIYPSAY